MRAIHVCGARVHDATVLAVYPNFLRRVAPQPSHVEYKPAAVAEAADASNQPGREVQVPVQRDDSHDDTLAFVEAVAARFSGALVGLEVSSASLDVAVLQLHAMHLFDACRSTPVLGRHGGAATSIVGFVDTRVD